MIRAAFLKAVGNLRVWRQAGKRAPHKPLLLLYALGRFQDGQSDLPFAQVANDLGTLLRDYGPSNPTAPLSPFYYLEPALWDNGVPADLKPRRGEPRKRDLIDRGIAGRLRPDVQHLLTESPDLIGAAAHTLADAHFPESIQDDLLRAVGLDIVAPDWAWGRRRRRDPGFRDAVLAAYEYRCAVCDFDLAIGRDVVGLEGAHVRWVQANGPDAVSNGLALCVLHHKLFDLGAWGLDPDRRVRVSDCVHGRSRAAGDLFDLHGAPLRRPVQDDQLPDPAHIQWHGREVFRGRPRPEGHG